MGKERQHYIIWVNWTEQVVSFYQIAGFDQLFFATQETLQHNIQLLQLEGFHFQ